MYLLFKASKLCVCAVAFIVNAATATASKIIISEQLWRLFFDFVQNADRCVSRMKTWNVHHSQSTSSTDRIFIACYDFVVDERNAHASDFFSSMCRHPFVWSVRAFPLLDRVAANVIVDSASFAEHFPVI